MQTRSSSPGFMSATRRGASHISGAEWTFSLQLRQYTRPFTGSMCFISAEISFCTMRGGIQSMWSSRLATVKGFEAGQWKSTWVV